MESILDAVQKLQRAIHEETPAYMVDGRFLDPDVYQILEAAKRNADSLLMLAMLLERKRKA
jgi:hypothetical protein